AQNSGGQWGLERNSVERVLDLLRSSDFPWPLDFANRVGEANLRRDARRASSVGKWLAACSAQSSVISSTSSKGILRRHSSGTTPFAPLHWQMRGCGTLVHHKGAYSNPTSGTPRLRALDPARAPAP